MISIILFLSSIIPVHAATKNMKAIMIIPPSIEFVINSCDTSLIDGEIGLPYKEYGCESIITITKHELVSDLSCLIRKKIYLGDSLISQGIVANGSLENYKLDEEVIIPFTIIFGFNKTGFYRVINELSCDYCIEVDNNLCVPNNFSKSQTKTFTIVDSFSFSQLKDSKEQLITTQKQIEISNRNNIIYLFLTALSLIVAILTTIFSWYANRGNWKRIIEIVSSIDKSTKMVGKKIHQSVKKDKK
jgi:hypothetical protein